MSHSRNARCGGFCGIWSSIEVDNAQLRAKYLLEVRCLTVAHIAEAAGDAEADKSATATRWKAAGRVFSVQEGGLEYFPDFQFARGQPRPIVKELLKILSTQMSAWEIAFWFHSSNSWLDGAIPVAQLSDTAGAVVEAALRAVDGLPT